MINKFPQFKFSGNPLSKEQTKQLMGFLINKAYEKPLNKNEDLKGEFLVEILLKRIDAYELPFMVSDFFVLASLMTFVNNPGKIMILLRICYDVWKESGIKKFNIDRWCKMFPLGPPTDNEMHEFWDSQKSNDEPLGNMVDNPLYWK